MRRIVGVGLTEGVVLVVLLEVVVLVDRVVEIGAEVGIGVVEEDGKGAEGEA